MLEYEITKRHAGIIVWGDTWALRRTRDLIHRVNEESPLIKNKEGFFLGLAYDLRKAVEGQRHKGTRKFFDDACPIYGFEILWPVLIAQVGLLRASLAFVPTSRLEHAIVYELEALIQSAADNAMPGAGEEVIALMHRIGMAQDDHVSKVLDSRCRYFIALGADERLGQLRMVLKSFDPMYAATAPIWVRNGVPGVIPVSEFEKHKDDGSDWPNFQW